MTLLASYKHEKGMKNAGTYEDWSKSAKAHDEASGNLRWKHVDQTNLYDHASIRRRLDDLRYHRSRHDHQGLLFSLNEGIHGNMGGMGRSALYHRAQFGTKRLVSEYVNEITEAIELFANPDIADISTEEKLDFFRRAQHCYGQSALMLSGAGMLLYFHQGVVKALWEQGLLPDIISGSSGGAIVGALVCTHTDKELEALFDPQHLASRLGAGDYKPGILERFSLQISSAQELREGLEQLLPDLTFAEAYNKTGRRLNISVAPQEPHQTSRLLNATASPNVLIREAVMASSAVPGIFPAVTLAARDRNGNKKEYLPTRKWVDGAVTDDLPAKRLARLYGVNHFIVSQTNPHVIPFIRENKRSSSTPSIISAAGVQTVRTWLNASVAIAQKRLWKNPRAHMAMLTALAIIDQDYLGDINILPPFKIYKPNRLLSSQISATEIQALISMGEKSTWPEIERIRIQTKISRTLNRVRDQYELPANVDLMQQ